MTATIYWTAISEQFINSTAETPDDLIRRLEKIKSFPCVLTADDIPVLEGMAAMLDTDDKNNPYQVFIDAILEFGSIRVSSVGNADD
jgi:hypothetical protein